MEKKEKEKLQCLHVHQQEELEVKSNRLLCRSDAALSTSSFPHGCKCRWGEIL